MKDPIPVNPSILRWARESQGMSFVDVAELLKRDPTEIEAWERGDAAPTYVQLETLAYKIFKRSIALFFFPEPPEEESIEKSFRTLPEWEIRRIPPRIRLLLRKAQVLQLNLEELYEEGNPAQKFLLKGLDFNANIEAVEMAQIVREFLDVTLEEQISWQDEDIALNEWRKILENFGVFIFKDSFKPQGKGKERGESAFSGFCLYHTEFPIIYVNNNKAKTRQIFTLFHELAHLLMATGGVDTQLEDYEEYLTGENKQIEILCNQFASEFLIPTTVFEAQTVGLPIDDELISELAHQFSVSREVVLRRFLNLERVGQDFYEGRVLQWAKERTENRGTGGNYYATHGTYLGARYVERVFSRYRQNQITLEQVADFLGEKPKNIPGVEAWLFGQGEAS